MKSWHEVTNCVKRYQAERLAAAVTSRLASADPNAGKIMLCENHIPIPSLSQTVLSVPPIDPSCPSSSSRPPPPPPPSGTVASGGPEGGDTFDESAAEEENSSEQSIQNSKKKKNTVKKLVRSTHINWQKIAQEAAAQGIFYIADQDNPLQAFPVTYQMNAANQRQGTWEALIGKY